MAPEQDPDWSSLSPFPHPPQTKAQPTDKRPPVFVDSSRKSLGAENTLSPYPLSPILNIPLPDTFDKWRQEGYLSPPSDQARCGACYVFAAVGQLADRVAIATKKKIRDSLSTQFVLSCMQSKFEYGCGGTHDVPPLYEALMLDGMLGGTYRQYLFPYSGQQWDPKPNSDPKSPCYYTPDAAECQSNDTTALRLPTHCYPPRAQTGMSCTGTVPCNVAYIHRWYPNEPKFSFAKVFHLSENTNAEHLYPGHKAMEHYRLSIPMAMTPTQYKNNIRRIKESIYLYGPVTAVIPIYTDFGEKLKPDAPAWNDRDYVYEVDKGPSNEITGLHHVLLVGWGRDQRGEFWVVKNSWGVWWNYAGYFNARMGDPLLLAESNCHSAIPYNPLNGKVMAPFDHSAEAPPKSRARTIPRVIPAIVLIIMLILVALVLAILSSGTRIEQVGRRIDLSDHGATVG